MILLNDEEIGKLLWDKDGILLDDNRSHNGKVVARDQLKKVYELVSPYLYDTRGGWILEDLKKEAGG